MVAIQVDIALIVRVVVIQVIVEALHLEVIHTLAIEEVPLAIEEVPLVHREVHRQVSEVIITNQHIVPKHSHHRPIQELKPVSIKCI